MAQWILNELSLSGQFKSPQQFAEVFQSLVAARQKSELLRTLLRCTSAALDRYVCDQVTLKSAIDTVGGQLKTESIRWLANQGPFWTSDEVAVQENLFFHGNIDVTLTGLGEACRRRLTNGDAECVSFRNATPSFDQDPLILTHGLLEDPIGQLSIPNWTDIEALLASCAQQPLPPTTWEACLASLAEMFPNVWFAPDLLEFLDGEPFVLYVHERAVALLRVLVEMTETRLTDGSWSDRGKELYELHFTGDKAWFTDESDANKTKFKEALSFHDRSGVKQLCAFHGKIKTPQYRIHFPWPPKKGEPLEIVYIGPKLTKA